MWALATGVVDPDIMPADMTDRTPHNALMLAYAQTLVDVGIIR